MELFRVLGECLSTRTKKRKRDDSTFPSSSAASSPVSSLVKNLPRKINDSLYELQDPKPPLAPSMEILFFHGFHSSDSPHNCLETWESEDKSCIWPNTWLAEEFPGARIIYVSYDAILGKSSGGNSEMYILEENLAADFVQANIGQTPNCPVILVGHCFGGLVIKHLCLHVSKHTNLTGVASNRIKLETFLARVKAISYYGTPHRGTRCMDNATHFDNPLLGYFKVLSKEASRLNSEFSHLCEIQKWRTKGLGENKKTDQGLFQGVIVASEASSRDGEEFNVVSTDHIFISKPQSKKDRRFYALTDLLRSIVYNMEVEVLGHQLQGLPDYPTELVKRAREVQVDLKDKAILGICGMSGIGKTTLAKQVYNDISKDYEYTCFVDNVKGIKIALGDSILGHFHKNGRKVESALNWVQLKEKRTLIVMDDIDSEDQLCGLPKLDHFKNGSRIIITTRDKEVLKFYHNQIGTYDVEFLNKDAAKKLFCLHAFDGEDIPAHALTRGSHLNANVKRVVDKCGGLPLTIEVVGRYLRSHEDSPKIWEETIDKLQKAESIRGDRNDRVWASLRVSYDALAEDEQQMFIQAGAFFFEQPLDEALSAWSTSISNSESRWANLVSRSLVKEVCRESTREYCPLITGKTVWVHEQLRDLARSLAEDEMKSGSDELVALLNANEMKEETKALRMKEKTKVMRLQETSTSSFLPSEELRQPVQLDSLLKLEKLRYLDMNVVQFQGEGLGKKFPSNLSLLRWSGSPAKYLWCPLYDHVRPNVRYVNWSRRRPLFPISLDEMKNLAVLDLFGGIIPNGSLEALGNLTNMRILKLGNLSGLRSLNLDNLCKLRSLDLRCLSLRRLPKSIGNLSALEYLVLWDLDYLENLPESFGNLSSLVILDIVRCPGLASLPVRCNLMALKHLRINGCPLLDRLPESFSQLSKLQVFYLSDCEGMKELCDSFGNLTALRYLHMARLGIEKLPANFGSLFKLEKLSLENLPDLTVLPDNIGHLTALTLLTIGADSLRIIPESVGLLSSLEKLIISCEQLERLPQSLGQLTRLKELELEVPLVTTLPDTLGNITRVAVDSMGNVLSQGLRKLSISAQSLKGLPSIFGKSSSLQYLQINCANLKELPHLDLSGLSFLEELSIKVGGLNLPESIGRLQSLRILSLGDCASWEKLPDQLGDLSSLEDLSITNAGNLKKLPESLGRLHSLRSLCLSNCADLTQHELGRLHSLRALGLINCADLTQHERDQLHFLTSFSTANEE